MRIMENGDRDFVAVLSREQILPLAGRMDEVRSWVEDRHLALPLTRVGQGAHIGFPARHVALSFATAFVPGALAEIVRPLAEGVADYAEVNERDGAVEVSIRYVGDAGSGTGREPHDQVSEDYASFAGIAGEAGFEVEHVHSDHDTIEALLRPAMPRPA